MPQSKGAKRGEKSYNPQAGCGTTQSRATQEASIDTDRMVTPSGRDWLAHDGPPPITTARVLVASNPGLVLRSLLPTVIVGLALLAWSLRGPALLPLLIPGLVVTLVGVLRAGWWWHRFAVRQLLTTPTHLVLRSRGVVEQWVAWEDVERLDIVHSDPLPEWSRTRVDWFHVAPQPGTRVNPPQAIITGFRDMLVSRAMSAPAAQRVRDEAMARGISVEES